LKEMKKLFLFVAFVAVVALSACTSKAKEEVKEETVEGIVVDPASDAVEATDSIAVTDSVPAPVQ
jgi:ABC-type Fe3+-hydroxamate transport system substrate-binding protein